MHAMSSTTWRGSVLFSSCKQFMYCKMQRFSTQRATLTVLLFCAVLLYLQLKSNGGTFWNTNPQTVFKVNENSPLLKNVHNSTLGVCAQCNCIHWKFGISIDKYSLRKFTQLASKTGQINAMRSLWQAPSWTLTWTGLTVWTTRK